MLPRVLLGLAVGSMLCINTVNDYLRGDKDYAKIDMIIATRCTLECHTLI